MTNNKKRSFQLLLMSLMVAGAMLLAGCGSSDDDAAGTDTTGSVSTQPTTYKDTGKDDFSYETDPYAEMSDAELEALKQEAALKNKDEKNFYGTWRADNDEAYNLYGNLTIQVKKDGSFHADLSDGEEKLTGTWKKVNGGIAFRTELMSGKLFYGEYCEMTIDNEEWDYDDEDTGMAVTLQKIK